MTPEGEYGINPHVDTSFFTILASTGPGLVVQARGDGDGDGGERGGAAEIGWVRAPHRTDTFVLNFGELLARATNDRWPATRHYALHAPAGAGGAAAEGEEEDQSRLSLPFFFNATPTHRMGVIPSCCSATDPARYPPQSYLEGQGVAQGE